MPAFRWSDLKREHIEPEYSSATGSIVRGEKISVGVFVYPAATEVKPHASPHERVHSILKGKARYHVGGDEKVVGPGEAVLIRPNTEHSAHILEEMEVIAFQDVGPATRAKSEGAKGPAFFTWDAMRPGAMSGR